jgi:hypothetical protein
MWTDFVEAFTIATSIQADPGRLHPCTRKHKWDSDSIRFLSTRFTVQRTVTAGSVTTGLVPESQSEQWQTDTTAWIQPVQFEATAWPKPASSIRNWIKVHSTQTETQFIEVTPWPVTIASNYRIQHITRWPQPIVKSIWLSTDQAELAGAISEAERSLRLRAALSAIVRQEAKANLWVGGAEDVDWARDE